MSLLGDIVPKPIDPSKTQWAGMYQGNCTDFGSRAALKEQVFDIGKWRSSHAWASWNGKEWLARGKEIGAQISSTPKVGWIGTVNAGTYGHVFRVAELYPSGNMLVEEYNYNSSKAYHTRIVSQKQANTTYLWFNKATPTPAPTPTPTPTPAPTPTPQPAPAQVVPNTPSVPSEIVAGDVVIAWGRGFGDSYGGHGSTREFPETRMKVIGMNREYLALNQYGQGTVGKVSDVTGWWPRSQVRKV